MYILLFQMLSAQRIRGNATKTRLAAALASDVSRRHFSAGSPLDRYNALLAKNQLRKDSRQTLAIQKLNELYGQLMRDGGRQFSRPRQSEESPPSGQVEQSSSGGLFGFAKNIFGRSSASPTVSKPAFSVSRSSPRVKGLYIYGGVGSGKVRCNRTSAHCRARANAKPLVQVE